MHSNWIRIGIVAMTSLMCAWPCPGAEKGQAEHVVVLVWDGMRRDFITPQFAPNLYALSRSGVYFRNHHSVFPSTTEVNGTAIATGCYPQSSGIMANSDYRPDINFLGSIATESMDTIRRSDMLTGGQYLKRDTLAETLQKNGIPTAIAGTKPVALLHDRKTRRTGEAATNSVITFAGQSIPKSLQKTLEKAADDKKFPETNSTPNVDKDNWTTKAMIKGMWAKGVPKYSLLWFYEPDSTQHAEGVGADQSLAGIANNDKNLEEVLKMLDEKNVRETTDIIVVSDHGFSNVKRGPDVMEAMKKAKFKAVRKFEDPEPGEILVVGHGGAASFYVVDHDEKLIQSLVEFLQGCEFTGVIFSRLKIEGTFPMEAGLINTTNVVPDVVIAMRWVDEANDVGTRGTVFADGGTKGKGTHGSLSPYEVHNSILIAAGPDFKKGLVSDAPSGNVDVAPTVLHLLGVAPTVPMDGRVLREALVGGAEPKVETKTLKATRDLGVLSWQQYLKFSKVGTTIYLDEGNGAIGGKKP